MSPPPQKMGLDFLLSAAAAVPPAEQHPTPAQRPLPVLPPLPLLPSQPPAHQAPYYPTASPAGAPTGPLPSANDSGLVTPLPRHTCRCGSSFNRSLHYLHHIATTAAPASCDAPDTPLYPCEVPDCLSAFRRKTDRAKHVSCVHSKLRPYKCDAPGCGSAFFFNKDMRKHYATVHLKERPFRCGRCDQSFGKKEHLKNHVNRTHLRIKPYGCTICNVRLASKHNLQSHVKTRAHIRAEAIMRNT